MNPPHSPVLTGQLVFLRELQEKDASEDYASWLNDSEVNQFLETRHVTTEELRAYIREKQESSNAMLFGIFWKDTGKHVGNVKLEPIDHAAKETMLGILIGDKQYWGKGIATEATNLLTEFAFTELHMEAVTLGVIAHHTAAIRVYEKCGFQRVKTEEKAVDHDGVLYDRVVMRKTAPLHSESVQTDAL